MHTSERARAPLPCSDLVGIIKEKKGQLPKPDAEGNRAASPLDGEIAALEAVRPHCCPPFGCITTAAVAAAAA